MPATVQDIRSHAAGRAGAGAGWTGTTAAPTRRLQAAGVQPGWRCLDAGAALCPGGVLLIEEADHFPVSALGTGLYAAVFEAFLDSAVRAGMVKKWARTLPVELRRRGLKDVWTDCDASLYEGGSVQSEFWRLSLAQTRELVMAEGISPQQIDEWDSMLGESGSWFPGLAFVAACGRRDVT